MNQTLERIRQLREYAGLSVARAYDGISGGAFSEQDFSIACLSCLRENPALYDDGWYEPPPHGIITIFGKPEEKFSRISMPSFRPESGWPRPNIRFDPEDIALIYVSPIDKQTNLIGDFGLNLYRGTNREIRAHFENVLRATLMIAQYAKVGMTFSDLYLYAMDLGKEAGFKNNIKSSTDKAGTNIGHTLPGSFATDPAKSPLSSARSYTDVKNTISSTRIFINAMQKQTIESNMAFTIEPRFSTDTIPDTLFHLTMIVEEGEKRICHAFRPIMEKTGMDYLAKLLP